MMKLYNIVDEISARHKKAPENISNDRHGFFYMLYESLIH